MGDQFASKRNCSRDKLDNRKHTGIITYICCIYGIFMATIMLHQMNNVFFC